MGTTISLIVEAIRWSFLSIRIFNRWGKEVWDGSGRDIRWNGRNNDSNVLTDGVYYYEMIRTGPGVSETYTGYVQVLLGR
ncbi:MAG: gliding motility-associated C-terminal domain-containing protein [Flavobacteriales bacterium]|nr:gliding motility-associated C-terminal domain-containing protein [Flavobacteriales bacterium]